MTRLWAIGLLLSVAGCLGFSQKSADSAVVIAADDKPVMKANNSPSPVNQVQAVFPAEARKHKKSGVCAVSLTVDTDGVPRDVKVVRCSDPVFAQATLDAAAKYRFNPATTRNGEPVPANTGIEVTYRLNGFIKYRVTGIFKATSESDLKKMIRYELRPPPGVTSILPDDKGVRPLNSVLDSPALTRFIDDGYRKAAFRVDGNCACDVVLTIGKNGRGSDPQAAHCENPALERTAVASLLKSHYKPARMNGESVPVRVSVHLDYGQVVRESKVTSPEHQTK